MMAALVRAIIWRERRAPFDPRWPLAADRRQALPGNAGQRRPRAGQRRLVVRRASGGKPAGPRRLAVPGSSAVRSQRTRCARGTDRRTAATAARTVGPPWPPCRRDHRDSHDRRYRCAAGRGRHERAACTVRAAAVSIRRRRTMTNQAGLLPAATVARTV